MNNIKIDKNKLIEWYKHFSIISNRINSLREDIPLNLKERNQDAIDIELFDMKIKSIQEKNNLIINDIINYINKN